MKNNKTSHGFTLIELLVVIAVIAILASILFPVFAIAKKASYQSVCASNLRQFGHAFTLYADNWEGRLPVPGGTDVPGWLYDDTSSNGHNQTGALWPYLRTQLNTGSKNNLWSCPLAVKASNSVYSPGQNYIMNDYLRAGTTGEIYGPNMSDQMWRSGILASSCPHSSKVILLYEAVQDGDGGCARNGSPFFIKDANPVRYTANKAFYNLKYANLPQNYHNGKSNFLFLDGHVKALRPEETISEDTYKNKSNSCFQCWKTIYKGFGSEDLWNPHSSNVCYP